MACCNACQMRWHPMMIRFCLLLAIKLPSAYGAFQNVLYLPSRRRLRNYINIIRPQAGFSPQVINELKSQTKAFSGIQRYIVLLFDEMKIQSNLVFDKHTNELIGVERTCGKNRSAVKPPIITQNMQGNHLKLF